MLRGEGGTSDKVGSVCMGYRRAEEGAERGEINVKMVPCTLSPSPPCPSSTVAWWLEGMHPG